MTAGQAIGRLLTGSEILLISGELGAGKTLFVKGVASALAIPADQVVSPTFVLMNLYQGRCLLYHFDLYRLGLSSRMADPGIDEYLGEGVVAVEWAQYLPSGAYAGEAAVKIEIHATAPESRTIAVRSPLPYIRP